MKKSLPPNRHIAKKIVLASSLSGLALFSVSTIHSHYTYAAIANPLSSTVDKPKSVTVSSHQEVTSLSTNALATELDVVYVDEDSNQTWSTQAFLWTKKVTIFPTPGVSHLLYPTVPAGYELLDSQKFSQLVYLVNKGEKRTIYVPLVHSIQVDKDATTTTLTYSVQDNVAGVSQQSLSYKLNWDKITDLATGESYYQAYSETAPTTPLSQLPGLILPKKEAVSYIVQNGEIKDEMEESVTILPTSTWSSGKQFLMPQDQHIKISAHSTGYPVDPVTDDNDQQIVDPNTPPTTTEINPPVPETVSENVVKNPVETGAITPISATAHDNSQKAAANSASTIIAKSNPAKKNTNMTADRGTTRQPADYVTKKPATAHDETKPTAKLLSSSSSRSNKIPLNTKRNLIEANIAVLDDNSGLFVPSGGGNETSQLGLYFASLSGLVNFGQR